MLDHNLKRLCYFSVAKVLIHVATSCANGKVFLKVKNKCFGIFQVTYIVCMICKWVQILKTTKIKLLLCIIIIISKYVK